MQWKSGASSEPQEAEWWKHALRITVYCWAFFAVGWSLALPGAALAYLAKVVRQKEAALGVLFTARGAAYATSSLAGGLIGDALNGGNYGAHLVMSVSMVMAAVGMWAAARVSTVAGLGLALTGTSVAMGALDTVGNMATLRSCERVRSGATSAMSVVHACFGMGCVAAPTAVHHVLQSGRDERAAFDLCALAGAGCAAALLVVPGVSLKSARAVAQRESRVKDCCSQGPSVRGLTKLAASVLIFTYVGVEQATGALLSTWAYRSVGRGKRRALQLTTTLWFAMVAGRLLAGLAVPDDVRADALVAASALVACASGAALALIDDQVPSLVLSLVVFALGAAYGPVYPVAFARLEARLGGGLSATLGGVLVTMGGLGEMFLPLLVFRAWRVFGPVAFGAAIASLSFLCLACWGLVLKTTGRPQIELLWNSQHPSFLRRHVDALRAAYAPLRSAPCTQIGQHTMDLEMEESGDEDDPQLRRSDSDSSAAA